MFSINLHRLRKAPWAARDIKQPDYLAMPHHVFDAFDRFQRPN